MVAAARQKNPKKLIALDLFDWKLDIAKKAGADLGVEIICLSYLSLLCPMPEVLPRHNSKKFPDLNFPLF